jgi:hypothetical protein
MENLIVAPPKREIKPEYILCAAIHYVVYPNCFSSIGHSVTNKHEYPGLVLCGWRHAQIISQFYILSKKQGSGDQQGFLTSLGRFVTREEALIIAKREKQVGEQTYSEKQLYSEDLY